MLYFSFDRNICLILGTYLLVAILGCSFDRSEINSINLRSVKGTQVIQSQCKQSRRHLLLMIPVPIACTIITNSCIDLIATCQDK